MMDDTIHTSDLKVEALLKHPQGGQHVGFTPTDVRITHLPTGITATCGWFRSQHKNRAMAYLMILEAVTNPMMK